MNGYLRLATISPKVYVGNVLKNKDSIKNILSVLNTENVKVVVSPRLALTSLYLSDVFFDENILNDIDNALFDIVEYTKDMDMVIVITHPLKYHNSLYEVATVINKGRIIGMVPRDNVDINDKIFSKANDIDVIVKKWDKNNNKNYFIPFNKNLVFVSDQNEDIKLAIKFTTDDIDTYANIILNPSSIRETYDADKYYHIYKNKSKLDNKVYAVASPSYTESTTKDVFYNRSMIYECGELINKSMKITDAYVIGDIDIDKLSVVNKNIKNNHNIEFNKEMFFTLNNIKMPEQSLLYRALDTTPYINKNTDSYNYSMHIVNILAIGLLKRYYASNAKSFVIGLSGGLDSTLALMVIKKACDIGVIPIENIKCVTMPCFSTSNKSMENCLNLSKSLGINIINIDIKNAVENHLKDIGHNIQDKNTTYENAQARERMQVLMDIANESGGFVVGTSDLSEIAVGFSTYNGDHMSMYNVNCSVPKTLIKYMLKSIAEYNIKNNMNVILANTLLTIIEQPISPELINDTPALISQRTEDILGPYKLIDFYMYYYLSYHFDKEKLFDMAKRYFIYNEKEEDRYDIDLIKKTLDIFMDRFYKSQYKRNASPDGPSIGYPDLNSRQSFVAPSDMEI